MDTLMDHHIKRFLFKSWPVIAITIFTAAILSCLFGPLTWQALVAIEGGIVSFALSVQKQQLEEIRLSKELFEAFNKRYDALNEELNRIYRQPADMLLADDEIDSLFRYFSLFAE